ncbi:MAG: peptidylprolyl isomerase, partial [Planctomycetota bacterium]|nr:peptidylprolyl isomerase [Planctomycetota bacterium]
MTSPRTLLLLALASFLPACGDEPGGTPAGDDPPAHTPEFDFAPGGPISDAQLAEFHVELDVSFNGAPLGTLVFELWPTLSPRSVRRFLRHAAERAYDRAPFHRVAREFIVQGGDPTGTGDTLSPYGLIPAELSADPSFDHGYGVLTMIPDSSMQFFICVAESPRVWALDEQPFSRLGKLTAGVPTLEQVANVPVGFGGMEGERTAPVGKLLLESVRVVRGPAPTGELIRRPPIDLQGQPEVVAVEHIFVTFTDRSNDPDLIRNRVEAQ